MNGSPIKVEDKFEIRSIGLKGDKVAGLIPSPRRRLSEPEAMASSSIQIGLP